MRTVLALLLAGFLAGCVGNGGGGRDFHINPRGKGVDGLTTGHRLMAAGEYELALKSYTRAASEVGLTSEVVASIGSANMRLDRLGQAEALLRKAVEMDETNVAAMNNLGVVLMERDKPGEAKLWFERAYAQDSGETDSIRENLKRAIAAATRPVYTDVEDEPVLYDLINGSEGQSEETLNSL